VVETLRPASAVAALLAFMETAAAALAEREPDPEEEAERAAIFGLPAPAVTPLADSRAPEPESRATHRAKRPPWVSQNMEGRTLALLRTPGVEVIVERDGWLRVSTPEGAYALVQRETAEHVGWQQRDSDR
jgi:hypothetical protein